MREKAVSGLLLILLLIGILPFVFYVQPAKASETIYIRADGSIDPPTANITTVDNVTYTLTGNINESIVIQRNNIVLDGAGYVLQGTESGNGIALSGRSNVTVKNVEIKTFGTGIGIDSSSDITISANNITGNRYHGIDLYRSTSNTAYGNNITANSYGIDILLSSNNVIYGNNITNNGYGIDLDASSNNTIYNNNFVDNTRQVPEWNWELLNVWDAGYPYGGNYWSDYTGIDVKSGPNQDLSGSDGIGDTPYVIDENNRDKYPLMEPYPFAEPYPWASHDVAITSVTTPFLKTTIGTSGYGVRPTYIYVIAFNQGNNAETFNVTIFPSTIGETREVTLSSRSATVIPFEVTDCAKGNYTLSANATIVPGETDNIDNTYTDGWVLLTIVGDVDGDRDVDVGDQRKTQLAMFSSVGQSYWNPNADGDNDGDVDVGDQRKQAINMFESW